MTIILLYNNVESCIVPGLQGVGSGYTAVVLVHVLTVILSLSPFDCSRKSAKYLQCDYTRSGWIKPIGYNSVLYSVLVCVWK